MQAGEWTRKKKAAARGSTFSGSLNSSSHPLMKDRRALARNFRLRLKIFRAHKPLARRRRRADSHAPTTLCAKIDFFSSLYTHTHTALGHCSRFNIQARERGWRFCLGIGNEVERGILWLDSMFRCETFRSLWKYGLNPEKKKTTVDEFLKFHDYICVVYRIYYLLITNANNQRFIIY